MLVLSRKKNESIVINNDIVVTVVEIRGDKVRLGIVAPKEVPVHRQEVYDAIREENERAAALRGQLAPTDFDVLRRTIGAGPAKSPARERTRLIATPHVGNPATGAKGSQRGRNSGNNGGVAKSA